MLPGSMLVAAASSSFELCKVHSCSHLQSNQHFPFSAMCSGVLQVSSVHLHRLTLSQAGKVQSSSTPFVIMNVVSHFLSSSLFQAFRMPLTCVPVDAAAIILPISRVYSLRHFNSSLLHLLIRQRKEYHSQCNVKELLGQHITQGKVQVIQLVAGRPPLWRRPRTAEEAGCS